MTSCPRVLVALSILGILSVRSSWGQLPATAPIGGLATTVKNATVIDAATEAQIKTFITGELGKFREVNTDAVPKNREALINEARGGSAAGRLVFRATDVAVGACLGVAAAGGGPDAHFRRSHLRRT